MDLFALPFKSNFTRLQVDNKLKKAQKAGEDLDPSTHEERIQEGEEILQMIQFGSVIPERENLPYYIIGIDWFNRWQRYTGCFKVKDVSSSEDEDAVLGRSKKNRKDKQNGTKDKSKLQLGEHPGHINPTREIAKFLMKLDVSVTLPRNDFYGNHY